MHSHCNQFPFWFNKIWNGTERKQMSLFTRCPFNIDKFLSYSVATKIFSISCIFSRNFNKIVSRRPLNEGWRPLLGKSWIRLCTEYRTENNNNNNSLFSLVLCVTIGTYNKYYEQIELCFFTHIREKENLRLSSRSQGDGFPEVNTQYSKQN